MDLDQKPRRLLLQEILEEVAFSPSGEESRVYFQPPSGHLMAYPCIVYLRDDVMTQFADNSHYRYTQRYQVTVIDRDPDSNIPGRVAELPLCRFDRHFTADDLNHDVYHLFF